MIVDCQECEMYESDHCKDCFVMAVLSHKAGFPLVIDPEHEPAVTSLQEAGLAPVLKFTKRAS